MAETKRNGILGKDGGRGVYREVCNSRSVTCFHGTFVIKFNMKTSENHESIDTLHPNLRGFGEFWCFHHHFFVTIFRFCTILGIINYIFHLCNVEMQNIGKMFGLSLDSTGAEEAIR